jgi:hypothetical protein
MKRRHFPKSTARQRWSVCRNSLQASLRANGANFLRVTGNSEILHLGPLSSIVIRGGDLH